MSSSPPLVYLILGTPGAGRRAVVRDLIENGLGAHERGLVLLAEGEKPDPADTGLAGLKNAEVRRWHWQAPGFPALNAAVDTSIFLLADPRTPPVDQVEALKPWLVEHGAELARIITVVDCRLAEKEPALRQWFDACIHFSDVVFLARREGVANKWLSDFIGHYEHLFYPCHFFHLKKNGVENPALVLDPTPRRVSQYFDETDELPDVEIETDDEEEDEDESDDTPSEDPYLVRMRSGRREKEVPDLGDYLALK